MKTLKNVTDDDKRLLKEYPIVVEALFRIIEKNFQPEQPRLDDPNWQIKRAYADGRLSVLTKLKGLIQD